MGNIRVDINPKALNQSAFVESVNRAENRDRFKTKRLIATLVNIGLEKHKCPYQPKKNTMKENYEILLDCSPFESFEKSGEGLSEAIDRVEALLLEGTPTEQLQLVYVRQDATGEIVECYDVYEPTHPDMPASL